MYIINYPLSILKKNFIPTILRQFMVFVSFLILTDDTLGQKLSRFIIYEEGSGRSERCLLVHTHKKGEGSMPISFLRNF